MIASPAQPEPTLYKPESAFARAHAPHPGYACLQMKVPMPEPLPPVFHHHWLAPNEIHCPYDKKWLQEHAMVVWRSIGEHLVQNLSELHVVERCSQERREIEREIYEEEEDD